MLFFRPPETALILTHEVTPRASVVPFWRLEPSRSNRFPEIGATPDASAPGRESGLHIRLKLRRITFL